MNFVRVFCAVFLVFFVVGGVSEYRARNKISDKDFLLTLAAERFHASKSPLNDDKLYYQCGSRVLYAYDWGRNAVDPISYSEVEAVEVEPSVTYETVVLLASGWGVGEAAAYLRAAAGLDWRDKVAALLGGLSGYTTGRLVFRRTTPSCDGPQMIQVLSQVPGRAMGQAILRGNIDRYLLLLGGDRLVLSSQLPTLRKAFNSFVEQRHIDTTRSCEPTRFYSPGIHCSDFVAVESVLAKLANPQVQLTSDDYVYSLFSPGNIAIWASSHLHEVGDAFGVATFHGVTTKQAIVRIQNRILSEQITQLRQDAASSLRATIRYIGFAIAGLFVLTILVIGAIQIFRAFSKLAVRLSSDL